HEMGSTAGGEGIIAGDLIGCFSKGQGVDLLSGIKRQLAKLPAMEVLIAVVRSRVGPGRAICISFPGIDDSAADREQFTGAVIA
ncbi:MAG: hypothetical protein MUO63_03100, partial [Desulfobulbaceae bacterium]|nr:hypothetical protein [Desulfobulbaceae bacterium]